MSAAARRTWLREIEAVVKEKTKDGKAVLRPSLERWCAYRWGLKLSTVGVQYVDFLADIGRFVVVGDKVWHVDHAPPPEKRGRARAYDVELELAVTA